MFTSATSPLSKSNDEAMTRLLIISILCVASAFWVKAQQPTEQKTAATTLDRPQETANPENTSGGLHSITAPVTDGQPQTNPVFPPATPNSQQNSRAEIPKREKNIDD